MARSPNTSGKSSKSDPDLKGQNLQTPAADGQPGSQLPVKPPVVAAAASGKGKVRAQVGA